MNTLTLHRNLIKNAVIAATLALTAFASLAVTGLNQPAGELTTASSCGTMPAGDTVAVLLCRAAANHG